jgi:cbb3-type cytochrome c oxidase subunit III
MAYTANARIKAYDTAEALQGGETMAPTLNESCGCRMFDRLGLRSTLPAAILIALCATGQTYGADDTAAVSPQALRAKMNYCEVCHGAEARGFVGYYPIPRLAGQQVEYIENELKGFVEHKRVNTASPTPTNVMFNVGHVLSPAMITALATNFHDLNPKPFGGAPKELAAAGKKIFDEGLPGGKVPACASCHGPDAKGNGQIPRIAGQLYPYVVSQLTNWGKERTEENSSIMAPIAHELSESQIKAVAAYVSELE